MRDAITIIPRILIGFASGTVLAGGVVAFISIIGIVPLMAYRTNTKHHAAFFENAIALGSILGGILSIWTFTIKLPSILIVILSFACGNFVGVLVIALAEVLDVMPILDRRIKIEKGVALLIYAFAAGKLVGCLYYYVYPIFIELIE